MRLRNIVITGAALTAVGLAGCADPSKTDGADCGAGKCDSAEIAAALEGRNDVIADFLRSIEITPEGIASLDYNRVLFGIAELQGCDEESFSTFVVTDDLVSDEPFPRLIAAVCSNDNAKAANFFLAASFEEFCPAGMVWDSGKATCEEPDPNGDDRPVATGNSDTRDLEMFAWDGAARKFNFYATRPDDDNDFGVRLEIEPERCQQCHLTPSDTDPLFMPMTPIMNELQKPWTHWHAGDEASVRSMDFNVPERAKTAETYREIAERWLAPASRLEQIIRFGGQAKVASARARARRNDVNLWEVMGLLRPMFCAEQLNYVTEDFDSGVLFNHAIVDVGIRNMFLQVRPTDWPFNWVNDQTINMTPPTTIPALRQIPVRGFADLTYENQLVSVRGLTAEQVLRVKALDWKHPVFSDYRCGLWKDALDRFGETAFEIPEGATQNRDILSDVFENIMTIPFTDSQGATIRVPLKATDGSTLIVVDEMTSEIAADLPEMVAARMDADGNCDTDGFCTSDLDTFGARLEAHVESFVQAIEPRTQLMEMRRERICKLIEPVETQQPRFLDKQIQMEEEQFENDQEIDLRLPRFMNHPSLPDVDCGTPAAE